MARCPPDVTNPLSNNMTSATTWRTTSAPECCTPSQSPVRAEAALLAASSVAATAIPGMKGHAAMAYGSLAGTVVPTMTAKRCSVRSTSPVSKATSCGPAPKRSASPAISYAASTANPTSLISAFAAARTMGPLYGERARSAASTRTALQATFVRPGVRPRTPVRRIAPSMLPRVPTWAVVSCATWPLLEPAARPTGSRTGHVVHVALRV